ncbi:glycosyltransferase family 4 protein [Sphingobacterium sp. SG20118]|uniref:glycosyltransferase family 4 protein n=1 Tax=Sphingobacterium sp. SG20118 TaxID=3367156 RepID=UPI0037DFC490
MRIETSKEGDKRSYREMFNISDETIVYGVAARIYPGKAQKFVIDALHESDMFDDNRVLLIAGKIVDEEYWNEIKSENAHLFGNKVFYLSEIEDIKAFYSSVDILVNGGIEAEAFGISVAEGLGSSKPVIAYGLGGPLEMIEDGINGWIITEPSLECYIEGFKRTKVNREILNEMGKNSRKKAVDFSVNSNVVHLLEIIKTENGNTTK